MCVRMREREREKKDRTREERGRKKEPGRKTLMMKSSLDGIDENG